MGSHGTLAAVPQLWISSSPLASCAQPDPSLCQHTGALTGNLPGPQSRSQTPAASKLRMSPLSPVSIHSQCSGLSHPRGVAPPSAGQTPQLQAATGNPRTPSSELHPPLLGMPITREPRTPHAKCCLYLANHLALHRQAGRAQEVGKSQEGFSVDQNRLEK